MPPLASAFRLLAPCEFAAHLTVLDAMQDADDNVISRETAIRRMLGALEAFAPRCNCGRQISRMSAIGMVIWSCSCGWACKEAS